MEEYQYTEFYYVNEIVNLLNNKLNKFLDQFNIHKWNNEFIWFSDINEYHYRKVFKYKSSHYDGTFSWGYCFDFIPLIKSNKLVYNRTEKSVDLHYWELPLKNINPVPLNTYKIDNCWKLSNIAKGSIFHSKEGFDETFEILIFDEARRIADFFTKNPTIDEIIELYDFQINNPDNFYSHIYPSRKYFKAFLLAKVGQKNTAIKLIEDLYEDMFTYDEKSKLLFPKVINKINEL